MSANADRGELQNQLNVKTQLKKSPCPPLSRGNDEILPLNKGELEGVFDIGRIEKELLKNYDSLEFQEKWILSRIRYLSELVTESMEKFSFSDAGQELQAFTKNEFCDYYIEEFKLTKDTSKYGEKVIIYVLNVLLKLLHPYIPFVTEEIYQKL
jgi:valyl-tRNA synthetase